MNLENNKKPVVLLLIKIITVLNHKYSHTVIGSLLYYFLTILTMAISLVKHFGALKPPISQS